ncbi:hypothetical protein F2Q70_00026208 [Brassica cretica]|uniref:F-box/kelch-repeat protein n=1 Tax=Brassica cretica TaxID=69181 RepID=A0A8S9LAP2_BRACR|nr:hypothetical protein F2Q70_00026208 [Brassica cretica]
MAQIPGGGGDANKKPQEEPVLYASIRFPPAESPSWYTLHRDNVSLTLGKIHYIRGFCAPSPRSEQRWLAAARWPEQSTGRSIYVIGGCRKKSDDWVEVFDVKARSWRVVPGVLPHAHWEGQFVTCAVMDDKIFVLDPTTCLVFDPRVGALVEWDGGVDVRFKKGSDYTQRLERLERFDRFGD